MRYQHVATLITSFLLAGCAASGQRTVAVNSAAQAPAATQPQMRVVFVSRCPISQEKPESALGALAVSIGAEVGGKLVGNMIDSLADSLTKSDEVVFTGATRRYGFASVKDGKLGWNSSEGCMVVVIAKEFDRPMTAAEVQLFVPFSERSTDPTVVAELVEATGLSSPVLFYFEAITEYNGKKEAEKSAFAFKPVDFYYPAFVSPSGSIYSSRRDVAFKVQFSAPGAPGAFADIDMQWNDIKSGEISKGSVTKRMLPWHALPEDLDKTNVAATGVAVPVYPVNVKALFTETKQPRTFFKILGQALSSRKDEAETSTEQAITLAFSRQARATARLAAVTDVDKKYEDYIKAYDAVAEAQSKYAAAAGASPRVRQELLEKARIAALALGSAELAARLAYANANIGPFTPLPPLLTL